MKHGRKPTVAQMKFLKECGKNPQDWLVCKDTPTEMVIVHRHSTSTVKTLHKEG